MGQKVTFNAITKIIQVDIAPVDKVVNIDVKEDLYSDMKEDWITDATLNKFLPPISSVGGNPLPGSKSLGSTFFLDSAWSIRPYETTHRMVVNGNLYKEDGSSPYIPTIGLYNVLIESAVSSLVDSTVQQLEEIERGTYQDAAWIDVTSSNTGTNYPNGNVEYPVNNVPDATAICAELGFREIHIIGDLTTNDVTHDLSDLHVIGVSHINSVLNIGPDTICNRTRFSQFDITGTLDGESELNMCIVRDLYYFNGHIHDCSLGGRIVLNGSKHANIINCTILDILNTPIIDAGGSGQNLMMSGYSGRVIIDNLTGDSQLGIGLLAGDLIINDTCTAGVIAISGNGEVYNNAPSTCYVIDKAVNGTDIQNLQRLIETQRPHHTGTGNIWYWSQDLGNDNNDGQHKDRAFKTWNKVNSALINNNHDIVMLVPDNITGNTIITESITISKNYVFIRGPGRDLIFNGSDINAMITITGNGVELSGFRITNDIGDAVHSTGLFTMLDNIWIEQCNNGVHFNNSYPIIQNTKLSGSTGFDIKFEGDISSGEITNCKMGGAGSNAIEVNTSVGYGGIAMKDSIVVKSTGYAINLSATTSKFIIDSSCILENNTLGNVNDLGTGNIDKSNVSADVWSANRETNKVIGSHGEALNHTYEFMEHAVHIDTEALVNGIGSQSSPFDNITDAIDYAEEHGVVELVILAELSLDRNLKNFMIHGIGTPKIILGGYDLRNTHFDHCELEGLYTNNITAQDCIITGNSSLYGHFGNCAIGSTFTITDGGFALLKDCATMSPVTPEISLGGPTGTAELILSNHTFGIKLVDCNQPTDKALLNVSGSKVTIDSTCTNGKIVLGGIGELINNSTVVNLTDNLIKPNEVKDIHIGVAGHRASVGLVDTHYNDDDSVRNIFDITEDANGVVTEVIPQ